MMTSEQKHIARILFQNKLFKSNGQGFEDLFVSVMIANNPNFEPVKPHGNEGDQKNDGFNKKTGQYYQVYAPEGLSNKENIALDKLKKTIKGLFDYWNGISSIKEFYYVINDKYLGAWPSVHSELAEISKEFQIITGTFLSKDLEDAFLSLSEEKSIGIIGFLPSSSSIIDVNISTLGWIVDYLMKFNLKPIDEHFPENPDFDKKILFNKLSKYYGLLLTTAFYQDYIINDYFSLNSQFVKQDLKLVFSDFYKEAQIQIPEGIDNRSDSIFQYIWEKSSPENTKAAKEAVLVLMAHYFESCDIFDEPVHSVQKTLFS